MAPEADPYRTLGLSRDATLDEVRRAYRRLAKENHPDAAGEAALPRFLAIQAAYDRIAGPDARARRPGAARPTGPRRAWDAERDRTDATYRAYGGRRRTRPTGGSGAGAASGPSAERPARERPPGTSRSARPDRPSNKATLGSTSYDGADAEPFEPDWGGASWYGTTSGTYWTLNPKEYADPRKHGPEYQARARRKLSGQESEDAEASEPAPARSPRAAAPDSGPEATEAAPDVDAAPDTGERSTDAASAQATRRSTPPPTHTTSSWWEATAGHPETAASSRARPGDRRSGPGTGAGSASGGHAQAAYARDTAAAGGSQSRGAVGTGPAPGAPGVSADAILEAIRTWLDDAHPGTVGRIARALVGWAPIALGIGWLGGEMSGCGRFAAGCDDTVAASAWIVQIAALLLLIVVGRLARVASVATLATLAAAVPAALLLSATGSPNDLAAGRLALSGLLVISWVVGLGFGVVREIRGTAARRRSPPA
jgi:curved DNA-binding protein CbpA